MRVRLSPLAAAALVLLAWPAPSLAQRTETEKVHRVIAFSPGGTLKLKNFSGDVRVTGTDRGEVVVNATRRAPRERLDRIKLDIRESASTIEIDANKRDGSWWDRARNNVVETDLAIEVPRRTRLDVSVFSSDVTVTGVDAEQDVHAFSADLWIQDAKAPVKAKTFSGSIRVEMARGTGAPALDLDTFSGDIDVRLPEDASGSVDFSSFSGDLTSDLPMLLKSKRGRKVSAELNTKGGERAANSLKFHTFSGDVKIRR